MCSRLRSIDLDVVFAYKTARLVSIQDRRLGLLSYACMAGILAYILYSAIGLQRYRLMAVDVVGNARLQLRSPDAAYSLLPNQTLFCGGGNASYPGSGGITFQQLPCRYFDSYDAVFPAVESGAMFVSTRITESVTELPPGCEEQPVAACDYETVNSTTYYIGDVEMMTLLVDHLFSSSTLQVSKSGLAMTGRLLDVNGNVVNVCDDYPAGACPSYVSIGGVNKLDIVPLKTLLRAAGIASLDQQAGSTPAMSVETHRYAGLVMIVSLSYSNMRADTGAWSETSYIYTYRVQVVADTEYKAEETIPESGNGGISRRILDRHGVRIVVKQAGTIGVFDTATLIISLTASLGLLAVASTVVDLIATTVMPLRNVYAQYKTIRSVDFTDVSKLEPDELAQFAKEDLINPLPPIFKKVRAERHDATTYGTADGDEEDNVRPLLSETQRRVSHTPATVAVMTPAGGSVNTPASDLRRGSGISLTTHQQRPLPPNPPPRSAATR